MICIRGFQKLGQDPLKYKTDPYPFSILARTRYYRQEDCMYDIDNDDDEPVQDTMLV